MATSQPTPSETQPKIPKPASAPSSTPITSPPAAPESYEAENVHEVYEQIASHFSSTRYKAWPIVKTFLQSLPPGSIGLDIGCGNGKYLLVNPDVFIVGSDRSTNLAKIASAHQPHAAIVADTLALPHPEHSFDFAISIAVIHHLSTPARRRAAVSSILSTLLPSGKALIYVWALEQSSSRRGWDSTNAQDVMVPWGDAHRQEDRPRWHHHRARLGTNLPTILPPVSRRRTRRGHQVRGRHRGRERLREGQLVGHLRAGRRVTARGSRAASVCGGPPPDERKEKAPRARLRTSSASISQSAIARHDTARHGTGDPREVPLPPWRMDCIDRWVRRLSYMVMHK
ncbi:hypothetical protein EYC84_005149 [Monilinia fructicola]|uniref:Methyltransferase type 11 domain-containing protein n=1 Tax=Monilinia fructicola TaxID=38448 RepID=A0A5M9K3Z1_MONFR|nr:hypothetical protein EYC84_005149 [Monilinia fructicola]